MNKKNKLIILHTFHTAICIFWFALFFIPLSAWPGRMVFQFWWAIAIVGSELVWSQYAFGKAMMLVCPLTTWTQDLRGYSRQDERNYGHSYFTELFNKIGLKMTPKATGILLKASFVIIILQYILYKLYF